jgi:hypothetical protein
MTTKATPAEHAEAMRTMTTAQYAAYTRSERCPDHARVRELPTPPADDADHEEWINEAGDASEHARRLEAVHAWAVANFG